ncbi:MAG TPA: hypothetical protein VMZ28_06680 [Kofleriaceae bacterium]|nr:hypothetical protein [Kofleriaceae bacterium]
MVQTAQKPADAPDNAALEAVGLGVHIGFSTTGGLLSRIIRRITSAPVSHSFIAYRCQSFGEDMVLEASGQGFRLMAWKRFDKENKLVAMYRLRLAEPVQRAALSRMAERLGDSYDTLSLFGYVIRKWFHLKRTPFDSRDKLVCSEAVALFLRWSGVKITDISVVTPRDLLELAQGDAEHFELVEKGKGFARVAAKVEKRRARRRRKAKRAADPSPVG